MVLEKFRVQVCSGWDSAGLLVEVEAELENVMIFESIPRHFQVLASTIFTRTFPRISPISS